MADHTPHAEELAASPNLLERLRAAQLDPQMLRIGWLAEAADEIARLTRERDSARAECRAQRALEALCDKPLGDPTLEREEFWPQFEAANKDLAKARAANQMEDKNNA